MAATPLAAWQALRRGEGERRALWRRWLHGPRTEAERAALRRSVVSGRPYGSPGWVEATAAALGLRLAQRPRGRPRKEAVN